MSNPRQTMTTPNSEFPRPGPAQGTVNAASTAAQGDDEAAAVARLRLWVDQTAAWVEYLRTPGALLEPGDGTKIAQLLDEAEAPGTGALMMKRGHRNGLADDRTP